MITNRVWEEMNKAKSYQIQIELYTDRKRRVNRKASLLIVVMSLISAVTAFYPECKWATIISAGLVAIVSIIKEYIPIIVQPETELRELDNIHSFYKEYLRDLEKLFIQRFEPKSDVDDEKMNDVFCQITKMEGKNEEELNLLCRKMKKEERKEINERTKKYFDRNFKNIKYE